jgi:membrane carboxypeptidase/penicillin-binding protein
MRARRWWLIAPSAIAAYLFIVAIWAWTTFDTVMAYIPATVDAPLSARQAQILMLVEDPAFFAHHGVSLARGQGMATITGAVAREIYLDGATLNGIGGALQSLYRGVFACCKRIDLGRDVMAVILDARLSKPQQLALYASRVYMGTHERRQVRGLPAAARGYLGKPLAQTSDDEFIGLVAMIKAPNAYHPVRQPAAYAERVARVRARVAGTCKPQGWFDTAVAQCGTITSGHATSAHQHAAASDSAPRPSPASSA